MSDRATEGGPDRRRCAGWNVSRGLWGSWEGDMNRITRRLLLAVLVIAVACLMGCAPGAERFVERPAGFWAGVWHGLIIVITFIISLFTDSVRVYELQNTGGWYDFGFLLGLLLSIGGCFDRRHKRWRRRRRREEEWDEIARKVETRVRRGIDRWLDEHEQPDEEWSEIGRKIEEKIKRELDDWADS